MPRINNRDDLGLYMNEGSQPQQASATTSGDAYLDEIHKAASEKNYKALLQKDIAAYNLHANTRKYLDDALGQQGLGSQGYGTSAHIGAANQAQNLYAQNLEAFNQGEQDALLAAQERQKAASTENDNQLVTYLQYSNGSEEEINRYMGNYGYEQRDGQWVNKTTGEPASPYVVSAVQAAMPQSATSYAEAQQGEAVSFADAALEDWGSRAYKNVDKYGYSSVEALRQAIVANGAPEKSGLAADVPLGNMVKYELNKLEAKIKEGSIQDGTLIRLQNANGTQPAYLVLYRSGKLYVVSSEPDGNDNAQVATRYNEYKGPKTTIKGW